MMNFTEGGGGMKIEAELPIPDVVRSFMYVWNHHYIKLIDRLGNELKLNPKRMTRYACSICIHTFFAAGDHGQMRCPKCGGVVKAEWGSGQLCFMPDEESSFCHDITDHAKVEDDDRSDEELTEDDMEQTTEL